MSTEPNAGQATASAAASHAGGQQLAALLVDAASWPGLLVAESAREPALAAAIVSVELPVDLDATDAPRPSTLQALRGVLRPTDRVTIYSPTELAVLLAPVAGATDARALVTLVDEALRSAVASARVGWAMRGAGEDLLDVAARADAVRARAQIRRERPAQ